MGIFSFLSKKEKKRKPAKEEWPFRPPNHEEDRNFMLNEYNTFGIYQFIASRLVEGEIDGIHLFTVIGMENGYGQRYANILKNGIITVNSDDTSLVRGTGEWRSYIQPWLEGMTDFFPCQDGIIAASISDRIREFVQTKKL